MIIGLFFYRIVLGIDFNKFLIYYFIFFRQPPQEFTILFWIQRIRYLLSLVAERVTLFVFIINKNTDLLRIECIGYGLFNALDKVIQAF